MTCSHTGGEGDRESQLIQRRDFLKSAVAIGGTNALAACIEREDSPSMGAASDFYEKVGPPYPNRQHAWGNYLVTDPHGSTVLPAHHTLLFLDYKGESPTNQERRRVEKAFQTLERAYQWGVGDSSNAVVNRGLLFVVGYSPYYFEKCFGSFPSRPRMNSEELVEELDEDSTPDKYDVFIHLSSGLANAVLGAEEALFNNVEEINGVEVYGGLDDIFEKKERRTGFVGQTLPTKNFSEIEGSDEFDKNPVPEESPLWMGFKSGYVDSLPPEDNVTIQEGTFEGGTVAQVSQTVLDLEDWYQQDHDDRVEMMFSPRHNKEDVGETGQSLAASSRVTEEIAEKADEDAASRNVVGHTQKTADARDEDFMPQVLRRDFDTTHNEEAGMAFDGFMQKIDDFVELRKAMDGEHLDEEPEMNGILDFVGVTNRATFVVPPRKKRALPPV